MKHSTIKLKLKHLITLQKCYNIFENPVTDKSYKIPSISKKVVDSDSFMYMPSVESTSAILITLPF